MLVFTVIALALGASWGKEMAYTPPKVDSGSSASDIAYMYRQYADQNGGDTEANRNAAIDYLRQSGVDDSTIGSAYGSYQAKGGYQAPNDQTAYMTPGGMGGSMADSRTMGYGSAGGGMGNDSVKGGEGSFIGYYQPWQVSAPGGQPSSNLGMGGGGNNPYIGEYAGAITSQVTQNLQRNILPGISSGAMAAGGFGGSRQGVVEANALNDANQGLSNSLANLYGTDYTNAMNRNLQQQSLDNSYNLGLGNLNLGNYNATNSFYTAQRGQDLQSTALGAQLMNQGNSNYLGAGSGVANLGTSAQQAPWQVMGNYTGAISPFTGYGATTTSNQNSNPWAQALGGALGGSQIGNLFGGGGGMGSLINSGSVQNLPSMYLSW